jgi:hypothetical protein
MMFHSSLYYADLTITMIQIALCTFKETSEAQKKFGFAYLSFIVDDDRLGFRKVCSFQVVLQLSEVLQ